MRNLLRSAIVLALGAGLLVGCSDTDTFQNKLKGLWVLESRTVPDGTVVSPPDISGRLSWFPMNVEERTAHVSVLTTHGEDELQALGSIYDLNDYQTITRNNYLVAGGGLSKTVGASYQSGGSTDSGTIRTEGSKVILSHDGGEVYEFEGATLTITHPDGTRDTYAR